MRAPLMFVLLLFAGAAWAQLEPQPRAEELPPPLPAARLETPPELVAGADPIYPEEARIGGRGGDVVLRITIDSEGLVERVDVVQSSGVDLDWSALGAATNFQFAPATFCTWAYDKDGRTPIESCGTTGKVALDWKTTFQVQEQVVEVPVEPISDDPAVAQAGPLNFEGVVRAAGNKDPLEGVEVQVQIERAGMAEDAPLEERFDIRTVLSDEEGRFTFRGIPDGQHRVTFALSGYEVGFVDEDFTQKERTQVVIYLQPRQANRFETVVRQKRAQKDVARISLSREEVRKIPGTFGDPLRVIENLPGLARAPFIGGALIVRGANPADSGVYFDGVEIPLLYHFGGLTSVVNAEFLEDIDFYPGGFGAYYGRATAGIVDVSSRKLKMRSCRGYGEADLIDTGFFFACPLTIGELPTVTFAAAARRSYIDAILPFFLDSFLGSEQAIIAAPVYWDYQTKVETDVGASTYSLFAFGSNDDLKVLSRNAGSQSFAIGFNTQFHRLVGRWELRLSPSLKHVMQPYVGVTSIKLNADNSGADGGPNTSAGISIDTWVWGARDELTWSVAEGLKLRGGVDYLGQTFGVRFAVPVPVEIGSFPRVFPAVEGTEQTFGTSGFNNATAVYAEAELEPFTGLKIVPGVRAELTVFTFLPDDLVDGSKSKAAEARLFSIDPRLTARWQILPLTTVKAAAGVYRQAPEGQEINPDTGNPDLQQPRAVQFIAGIEQALTKDINLDVQLYYTNRDLLIQSTDRVRAINDSDEVDPLFYDNGGRGRTYGVELLLRHEITENFFGWIAYTLSRTESDLNEDRDRFLLTQFDQTHILTLVAQVQLPWAFTFGGRFRAVSGNLQSFPLGSVHDVDTTDYLRLGGVRERLPFFHQLDLRLDRKFVFDQFSATAYVDVLNVYNQQNTEGVQSDYRARSLQPIPSLPFLPVIGLSAEF